MKTVSLEYKFSVITRLQSLKSMDKTNQLSNVNAIGWSQKNVTIQKGEIVLSMY